MSWRRDVDVAGVPVAAHDVPELIRRLRERGAPHVAVKVERALGTRTVHVVFSEAEREAILRAVDDRPREFSELYAALVHELERRRKRAD